LRRRTGRGARRRGALLAITLWLLVLVVVVTLGLAYDTQLGAQSEGNSQARARCYYTALSGIERLCSELDNAQEFYTASGQGWEQLAAEDEQLTPESSEYVYHLLVEDNCGRLELNEADQAALTALGVLTEEQVAAILEYRGETAEGAGTPPASTTQETEARSFRSVDDLLLLPGFDPQLLFGAASWTERLSPAERFRLDWAQMAGGTESPAGSDSTEDLTLADLLAVGGRARNIAADGQPRAQLTSMTRDTLRTRLETVAQVLGIDPNAASSDAQQQGGRRGGQRSSRSIISSALRVLDNNNVTSWSQVWSAVNNNRDAMRLLADVLTMPGGVESAAPTGGGGGVGGGGGGGRPGGGGPGGGGPGGGRPGGGGPGGGGPGGGFPGGGGGFPGGGGGFPGGGGGGFPGGGGGFPAPRAEPAALFTRPAARPLLTSRSRFPYEVILAQAGAPGGATAPGSTAATGETEPEPPIEGAININTAPLEVLMSLPNMTEEVAQGIMTYREGQPFRSRGEILLVPEVTQASAIRGVPGAGGQVQVTVSTAPSTLFNAIIERITVVSDSYTVRALGLPLQTSVGTGRWSDLAVHLTAVIDRTTGRCRIRRLRQDN
jgi:hypothetical protein